MCKFSCLFFFCFASSRDGNEFSSSFVSGVTWVFHLRTFFFMLSQQLLIFHSNEYVITAAFYNCSSLFSAAELSCNFPRSTKNMRSAQRWCTQHTIFCVWKLLFFPHFRPLLCWNNAIGNFSLDRYTSLIMTVFLDNTCHDYLQRFF